MSALTLFLVLTSSAALPAGESVKLFNDKGSTYFRSDRIKAVTVGSELPALVDATSTSPSGKAVVMELSGKLARVSLDDDAAKAGAKFVLLPKVKVAAAAAAPAAAPAPAPAALPTLSGKLQSGALRVTVSNDSDQNWSACELRYADGSSYTLGEVVKHSDDAVLKMKFKGAPKPVYDHVTVSCAEGESRFYFAKPTSPVGKLRGYAVNEGGGSVVIHNSSDSAWTLCDVRKPDGTHFVLGTLKGHDHDGINSGRFIKEAEAAGPQWLELRCKEGVLRQSL